MNILKGLLILSLIFIASSSMAANHPFGLHGVYGDSEAASSLGVKQVRVAALTWGLIEPEKGRYDFAAMDRGLKKLQSKGINTIVATIRDINAWGGNKRAQKGYKRGVPLSSKSGLPSDIKAWKKFIHTVVERYDGDGVDDMPGLRSPIKYWQIEGEWMWQWKDTTENYLRFLRISHDEIKRADSSAKVVAGAVTGGIAFAVGEGFDKRGFIEKGGTSGGPKKILRQQLLKSKKYQKALRKVRRLLREGKDSFDILDVHIYSRDAYIISPVTKWLTSTMKGFGYSRPIWSLENAGPFYGYSEDLQAEEVVKRYMLAISSGMDKLFWSSLHVTEGWSDNFKRLSLIDESGRKKPAFFTYKFLASRIDGFDNIERLSMGEGVYAFKVRKKGARVYVLWADKGRVVSLHPGMSRMRVTETRSLKARRVLPRRGLLRMKLGTTPLIIEEL